VWRIPSLTKVSTSDRQKLIKEKPVIPPPADDDEDEYDDMYA
jgi:hypothetical protein